MSSKREQIMAAVFAKLQAMSSPTGGVFRSRVEALSRTQTPAVCLEPSSDQADPSMVGVIDWSLLIRVAIVVRGQYPDQLADPVIAETHAALLADKSLGGLSMDLEPTSVNFELLNGDQPVGVISLGYQISYRTNALDLTI